MINHDIKHNTEINCITLLRVLNILLTRYGMMCINGILAKVRNHHIACLKKEVITFSIQYKNILAPNALTCDQIQK